VSGSVRRMGGALLGALRPPAPAPAAPVPPGVTPVVLQGTPAGPGGPRPVTAWDRDGVRYLTAGDLSTLFGFTKYWRSELGRLTFAREKHSLEVTAGTDLARVDGDSLIHLPGPSFLWNGEMAVPLALFVTPSGKARPWVNEPVEYSPDQGTLVVAGREAAIVGASIEEKPAGWSLILDSNVRIRWRLADARSSSFVIILSNVTYDPLLYPLPSAHPRFAGLRLRSTGTDLEVSFTPGADVVGYRVTSSPDTRLEIFLGLDERDLRAGTLRPFAADQSWQFQRVTRVILDPGHGGKDQGDEVRGDHEADITWDLAERLARRLESGLGVEVLYTRSQDDDPTPEARAEEANRGDADLLVSLHVHARPGGVAVFTATPEGPGAVRTPALAALGFRTAGGGNPIYDGASRFLARTVADAVSARLGTPSLGIHAEPLAELRGAAMPAILVELGGDAKWTDERRDAVADGIVEGLRLFQLARGGSE
jgi:N-acetylmuramoyl-L-alanine amidase